MQETGIKQFDKAEIQEIVEASDRLNQMKREISIILSLVAHILAYRSFGKIFDSNEPVLLENRLSVRNWYSITIEFNCIPIFSKGNLSIPMNYVAEIHGLLPHWLNSLSEKFPGFETQFRNRFPTGSAKKNISQVSESRKTEALMRILERIIERHHLNLIALDEPVFKLYELAKRVSFSSDESQLTEVIEAISAFRNHSQ